jgi:hypothetical protein
MRIDLSLAATLVVLVAFAAIMIAASEDDFKLWLLAFAGAIILVVLAAAILGGLGVDLGWLNWL